MLVEADTVRSRTRTFREGWGWLLLGVVARAYLVFLVALAACALLPMLTGLSGAVVQSGSMEPKISAGDVVLSTPFASDKAAPIGRVITFEAPEGSATSGPVLHRLVGAHSDGSLITAGDANASDDSAPLARRDIVSQARLLVPGIGLPVFWLKTGAFFKLGMFVLLTGAAILLDVAGAPRRRPPTGRPSTASRSDRRRPLAAVGATTLALAGLVILSPFAAPLGEAAAAFTARTSSIANSWTAAQATKLEFSSSPSDTTAGVSFDTQPIVEVQDDDGALVTLSAAAVTLSITTPAGAVLSCTDNPSSADSGIASFDGCMVDRPGTYTLTATSGTLTGVSTSFTIAAVPADRLAFVAVPSSSAAASAFATQPVVEVQDADGNTVSGGAEPVTLSITTPAGAILSCASNPVNSSGGVATFAGCRVDRVGDYTLTAISGSLTSAVSTSFTIVAGPPARLAFATSPSNSPGGAAFGTQPVVWVQDAGGNVTTGNNAVSLSLSNPAGAVLTCAPVNAVAGSATFAGCKIDKQGSYTLLAGSAGLDSATSSGFTITAGPAANLAFTSAPSNTAVGGVFATQPAVAVQDLGGNRVTGSAAPVTLSITTPAGAVLTCTTNPATAGAGLATFAGCRIDQAGGYTLTATSGALASAVSSPFTIAAGAASKLAFTTNPSDSTGGTAFGTQPTVAIQDAGGANTATGTNSVTLNITSAGGATLTCTQKTKPATAGVVNFAACKIDLAGSYTLTATATGLTSAVSSVLTITVGNPAKLAFTTLPIGSGGLAFSTQPAVAVQDAGGNATMGTNGVSLTISTGPVGATLACPGKNAVGGVATFTGCSLDKQGSYQLKAASGGLGSGISANFTITTGPAAKLAFTTSPGNTSANGVFAAQPVVNVHDAGGNLVTGSAASVTLTLTVPGGATLFCTTNPTVAASGIASFAGCRIDVVGTYTLTASSSGLTSTASTTFTITP